MEYLYTGHHEQGLLLVSGNRKNTTGVVRMDVALGTSGTETIHHATIHRAAFARREVSEHARDRFRICQFLPPK